MRGHSIFHYRHQLRKKAAAGWSPLREGRKMQRSDVHRAMAIKRKQAENLWTDGTHLLHVIQEGGKHDCLEYHTE